jgi:hypothetical protein
MELIPTLFHREQLDRITTWQTQNNIKSRAKAIRELVEKGLSTG